MLPYEKNQDGNQNNRCRIIRVGSPHHSMGYQHMAISSLIANLLPSPRSATSCRKPGKKYWLMLNRLGCLSMASHSTMVAQVRMRLLMRWRRIWQLHLIREQITGLPFALGTQDET